MNPLGGSARGTPSARTPDAGMLRVGGDARASHAVARALVLLVERLEALEVNRAETATRAQAGVRDALRQLTARSRDGALLCRVIEGTLVLEGVPLTSAAATAEPFLSVLLDRLVVIGAGSLTVREGAAPGELLTLGRLLSRERSARDGPPSMISDTPTTVRVFGLTDDPPLELLRTWSVLVSPLPPARVDAAASGGAGNALARLASARTDEATSSAVTSLVELLDEAQRHGDAVLVESIARGVMARMHAVGSGGGRLALEGALRHLLRPPLLTLLANRLPFSPDRASLLQLLSRAGDSGVETLLEQLMSTDDSLARRAYFDGIVAMDVGSPQLFELLHDARWFVVRNAAALLGEMNVEETDAALLPLLQHSDERIRIAVARALTRVRTPKALQALHAVIDDPHPEVRRLSAAAFGLAGGSGGGIRPPAARLALALERETDEDVALEMLAALGRLGSADAVQRLLRIALPGTQDFAGGERPAAPRDAWQRIAALESLVRARGPAMLPAIESLLNDTDREVAAAAVRLRAAVTTGVSSGLSGP